MCLSESIKQFIFSVAVASWQNSSTYVCSN